MKETEKNWNMKVMNNAINYFLNSKGADYHIVNDLVMPKMRDIRGNEYNITVCINGYWNCASTPDEYGNYPYTNVYRMWIDIDIEHSVFMAKNSDIDWDTPLGKQEEKYGEDKVNEVYDLIDDYNLMMSFCGYLGEMNILDNNEEPSEKLIEAALDKIYTEIKEFNKDKYQWLDKEFNKERKEEIRKEMKEE